MMQFLNNIWATISELINFIIHSIQSLIDLISHIPAYVAMLTGLIAEIPTIYQGVILATISIAVIHMITGRNAE